jgi:prolycopene isomerase
MSSLLLGLLGGYVGLFFNSWLVLFLLACISLFIRRPFTLLIARPFYPPVLRSHSSYLKIHYIISTFWALVYGANALLAYYSIKGSWPYILLALGLAFSFTAPNLFIWIWIKTGRGSRVPRCWLKVKPSRQAVGCAVTPQYLETLDQTKAELAQSFKDKCDIAVVGAGIGGLTAAALLARQGYDVQVFEQHSLPGGYCTSFKRKGYTFDASVFSITGIEGNTGKIWQEAGMEGVEWIRPSLCARVVAPDKVWEIPHGLVPQEEYFSQNFPREREGIKKLYAVLGEINKSQSEIPKLPRTVKEAQQFPRQYPAAFKYVEAGWMDLLDEYLDAPQLKTLLSLRSGWLGAPPALCPVPNMASILTGGAYYPRGGTQRIPDALVSAIRAKGGDVFFKKSVNRIILDNGRAAGIELADGGRVAARVVLYAGDFRALVYKMLGRELLHPAFLKYAQGLSYSPSGFLVYLGLQKSFRSENCSFSQSLWSGYDPEKWYHRILEGKLAADDRMSIYLPTLLDPSLAPEETQIVILESLAPYDYGEPWKEAKAQVAEAMIRQAEKVIPQLSRAIEVQDAASPLTLERYTRNYQGASYGLAQIPTQMGAHRLPHKTPIPGLYLAGHNTFPGAGVQGAAISAWLAAREVEEEI